MKKDWARFTRQQLFHILLGKHNKVKSNKQSNNFSGKGEKRIGNKNN